MRTLYIFNFEMIKISILSVFILRIWTG